MVSAKAKPKSALFSLMFLLVLGSGAWVWGQVESPLRETELKIPLPFSLVGLDSKIRNLTDNDGRKVRVLIFLSTSCPVSNGYIQTINQLHKRCIDSGKAELFGVLSDRSTTRSEGVKHFEEYQASFPVLFDASSELKLRLEPTHVPEAFVLDADGVLVYRGAIDNAWEAIGRRRPKAEQEYVWLAAAAAIAGKKVETPFVKPVGCLVETATAVDTTGDVTFNRDIAPIIQTRCQNCHRDGQAAPFPLTNYEEVASHARQIVDVTQSRIMPPWIPLPNEHKFVGERWLTDRELALLSRWSESGKPQGDSADLPPDPHFAEGWLLGEPDMIVKMQEPFRVPADGPDLLQNMVIPIELPEDKMVAAVEFHPGNKRVAHHAVLFLDESGAARKLDAKTPEPGYANFGGPGFAPSGALGGWSVGNTPRYLPNGMGRYLKKGSDLVIQMHYHPTGKAEVDQSEVGLYFVKKPVAESLKERAKLVGSIWLANYEMDIPAGEAKYERSTSYTLPKEVIMVGVVPHMHLLGKSMKVTATLPDGSETTLIDVDAWNYNWQDEYYYEKPFKLPAGTKLNVRAVFDNSDGNPSNPRNPPQRVTWGEETNNEMLFCFFLLSADKTEDLIHVIYDNLIHDSKQNRKEIK